MNKEIARDEHGKLDLSQLREGAHATFILCEYDARQLKRGCATCMGSNQIHSYTVADEPLKVGDRVRFKGETDVYVVWAIHDNQAWISHEGLSTSGVWDLRNLERTSW